MRCGWVRREDWADEDKRVGGWGFVAGAPIRHPETCPGYTTQLPEVVEASQLWAWWEKSQLGMMADLPETVVRLVSLFQESMASARSYYLEETKPKK